MVSYDAETELWFLSLANSFW